MMSRWGFRDRLDLVNYFIHEPSTVVLYKELSKRGPVDFLWLVETDTALSNPTQERLRKFFVEYASGKDYITALIRRKAAWITRYPLSRNEHIIYRGNSEMKRLYRHLAQKSEHIEGFSARMVTEVEDALNAGAAAFGEVFASTVCLHGRGWDCRFGNLVADGWVTRPCWLGAFSECSESARRTCGSTHPKLLEVCEREAPETFHRWIHKADLCHIPEFRG
eukprot:TRINITY_DN25271_c0_g1_i2.p1 TRINITY_DN25271_c0_g1~~TRINITY_DN25271_c0_g1_i2.p1  ORF type:complete len:221 (+),score=21.38 TRINITY_DN25271_c0_g1_i2:470-1132(+)